MVGDLFMALPHHAGQVVTSDGHHVVRVMVLHVLLNQQVQNFGDLVGFIQEAGVLLKVA